MQTDSYIASRERIMQHVAASGFEVADRVVNEAGVEGIVTSLPSGDAYYRILVPGKGQTFWMAGSFRLMV